MLTNAVANLKNLKNVMRMKRENDPWVTNLHNTHCMCFSLSYICQPLSNELIFYQICTHCPYSHPAFYGNVNTNASESLQMSYDHYKGLANNKNGFDWLQICCEWLQICCEYAFLANFRSMFLIFIKPLNRAQMLGDHLAINANWSRMAFASPFPRYLVRCRSNIKDKVRCRSSIKDLSGVAIIKIIYFLGTEQ